MITVDRSEFYVQENQLLQRLVGPAPRRIALTAAFAIGLTPYLPAQVNFISSQTVPGVNVCTGLFAAHFNNDAKSDFLAACHPSWPVGSPPQNIALLNNGNGTFTEVVDPLENSGWAFPALVTDLNGDGISDLVLIDEGEVGYVVQLGNPDGTFRAANPVPGIGGNGIIVAGDFSGNGRKDLASIDFNTTASGTLTIALNKGDGTFQKGNSYTLNATTTNKFLVRLSSGDINGDGKADLAVVYGGPNGTVVPYLSSGNGVFVKGATFTAGNSPGPAAIGRLNSDAYGDLAIPTSTGVIILLGSPSGTLTAGHTVPYQTPLGNVRAKRKSASCRCKQRRQDGHGIRRFESPLCLQGERRRNFRQSFRVQHAGPWLTDTR